MTGPSFTPSENESFIHVEGLLSPHDQRLVLGYIVGQLGVNATYIDATHETPPESLVTQELEPKSIKLPKSQQESIRQHGFRFSDIQTPDDILVREHFEDFGSTQSEVGVASVIRAFHYILDQRGVGQLFAYSPSGADSYKSQFQQIREPQPLKGIVMTPRNNLDLKPYGTRHLTEQEPRIMARYAITAGSTLNALETDAIHTNNKKGKYYTALREITRQLKNQLEQ